MRKANKKYKILSIDGGGIRGIIPAIIIDRLTKELGNWTGNANLIAGTSIGGLIALALASGTTSADIRKVLESKGNVIFDDSFIDDLLDCGQLVGAQYGNCKLTKEIIKMVGGRGITLGDLKNNVLITSFAMDNKAKDKAKRRWKPKLFHNLPTPDTDSNEYAYKVGLYTSAAPTFFPAVDGYIDGAIVANNPCMCALAQTQDIRLKNRPELSDVVMISLSCGSSPSYIKQANNLDWGLAQWARPLLNIIFDAVSDVPAYQSQMILNDRFTRVNPAFIGVGFVPIDDIERVPDMIALAESYDLTSTLDWLSKHWL